MRCHYLVIGGLLAACGSVPDDPAPREVMLSKTNSSNITIGFGCRTSTTNYIRENSFYRSFALTDFGVTGKFHVKKVSFGVYSATSMSTSQTQPADITVYAYTGLVGTESIDLSKLAVRGTLPIQIRDTATPMAIEIPLMADFSDSDDNLVVEIHIGDGSTAMRQLYIGGNQQGEMSPGYERAPTCGHAMPVTFPAAGINGALVLSVTGDG